MNSNQFEFLGQVPATCSSKRFVWTVHGTSPCNQSLRVNSSGDKLQGIVPSCVPTFKIILLCAWPKEIKMHRVSSFKRRATYKKPFLLGWWTCFGSDLSIFGVHSGGNSPFLRSSTFLYLQEIEQQPIKNTAWLHLRVWRCSAAWSKRTLNTLLLDKIHCIIQWTCDCKC